jgi:hypothetical protein
MRHMVDDDVKNRIWYMDRRGLAKRSLRKIQELTSRVSTSDIPDVLSMLDVGFGAEKTQAEGKNGTLNGQANPIDVLLATNMISVGVDIKRLGLMVVTGQPKATAEYIQATSRIGRTHPGMVCVIYNWARPRDLSHYEQFEQYHATFYQQVEALSVTPFAPRALDRGLAALLAGIVRQSGPRYNQNAAAGDLTADAPELASAIASITRRVEEIDMEARDYTSRDLERLSAYWLQRALHARLGYEQVRDGITVPLLTSPEGGQWEPFTCLHSLRNVEPNVRLILDTGELDLASGGHSNLALTPDLDEEEQEA